jgi:prolyl oligopeptidase
MLASSVRFVAAVIPLALTAATAAAQVPAAGPLRYPPTRSSDQVDNYHGTQVADPYRWLEDTDAPETRTWIEAQNALTFGYLETLPFRAPIRERLERVWNYPKYSAPVKVKNNYFSLENSGLQNQPVLYVREGLEGNARVLLDMNTGGGDGTLALSVSEPSPNGNYLAYGVASGGSDWQEFRVRDVRTARDLSDTLKWAKFSSIAWTHDNKGFFYSRYDEPTAATALLAVNRNQKLYYHRLGTPQSADELIYARPDEPDWGFDTEVSDDGFFAIIHVWEGTDPKNRLYFIDLNDPKRPRITAPVVKLIDEADATYRFVQNEGTMFILRSDNEAPRGRLIGVNITAPQRENWRSIVPQSATATLVDAEAVSDRIAVTYLENAVSSLRLFSLRGTPRGTVPVPGIGTVTEVTGHETDDEFFYAFQSYLIPPTIYRYDLKKDRQTVYRQPTLPIDVSAYETKQVFVQSKDGTPVPMFITARRDLKLDGMNPTLLYGYGGFNVSLTPEFSPEKMVWLEMGGIYAVANLRGGGELGEAWHQAGILGRKQNVFDDFIAAGEYLIAQGYTSAKKLAIQGGSNGGLLVGAVTAQRPDLFAVALPAVGVMDMLRFHKFTIGWAWVSDYGSADDPAQFRFLYAYSPLHNLKKGTAYPATLITTGDHDDRVVPGHSFKYAAALQAAQGGDAPILIRIDTRAGHGAGKPTTKRIEEAADRLAFTVRHLNMTAVPTP